MNKMNKCYKASLLLFSGALSLAGCDEQPEPATKVEVSNVATPSAAPAVTQPTPLVAAAPVVVESPKPYEATLEEGIDFKKPGYPTFIKNVSGMSGFETNHRWSDAIQGAIIKFEFKNPLPKKFTLEIVASAFGPNDGLPIKIRVGEVEQVLIINNIDVAKGKIYSLLFTTDGKSATLEFIPPKAISPIDLDPKSGDNRKLAINFVSLKIKS